MILNNYYKRKKYLKVFKENNVNYDISFILGNEVIEN